MKTPKGEKEIILRNRRKKTMGEFLLMIVVYAIYPFYKLGLGIVWLWKTLFYETIDQGSNGIFGPGYRRYYTTRFSWGKLSFFLLVILLIVVVLNLFWGIYHI